MKGRRFATKKDFAVRDQDYTKSAYQKSFEDWKKSWHKYIISEGISFKVTKYILMNKLIFARKIKIHHIF